MANPVVTRPCPQCAARVSGLETTCPHCGTFLVPPALPTDLARALGVSFMLQELKALRRKGGLLADVVGPLTTHYARELQRLQPRPPVAPGKVLEGAGDESDLRALLQAWGATEAQLEALRPAGPAPSSLPEPMVALPRVAGDSSAPAEVAGVRLETASKASPLAPAASLEKVVLPPPVSLPGPVVIPPASSSAQSMPVSGVAVATTAADLSSVVGQAVAVGPDAVASAAEVDSAKRVQPSQAQSLQKDARVALSGSLQEAIPSSAPLLPVLEARPLPPVAPPRAAPRPQRFTLPQPPALAADEDPSLRLSWQSLRGFTVDHLGWFIGAFLTLVGSFYIAATYFDSLSWLGQKLIILAFIVAYAGAFFGIARYLSRFSGLELAARVLATLSIALWPATALPLGKLFEGTWGLAGACLVGTGALAWPLIRGASRLVSPPDAATFVWSWLPMVLLLPLATPMEQLSLLPALPWLAMPFLWLALWQHNTSAGRQRVDRIFALSLHGYTFLLAVGLATSRGLPSAHLLPLLVLVAGGVFYLDLALARWQGVLRPQLDRAWSVLGLLLMLVTALVAVPLTFGDEVRLSTGLALALASALALGMGQLYRVRWLSALAWPLSTLAWLGLCLGVGALLPELFPWLAERLGYSDTPVPLAWYAVIVLPAVLLPWLLETPLQRLDRPQVVSDARGYLAFLATSLMIISISPTDVRPTLLAGPLLAALGYALYRRTNEGWSLHLAHAYLAMALWQAGGLLDLHPLARATGLAILGFLLAEAGRGLNAQGHRLALPRAWRLAGLTAQGILAVTALGHLLTQPQRPLSMTLLLLSTVSLERLARLRRLPSSPAEAEDRLLHTLPRQVAHGALALAMLLTLPDALDKHPPEGTLLLGASALLLTLQARAYASRGLFALSHLAWLLLFPAAYGALETLAPQTLYALRQALEPASTTALLVLILAPYLAWLLLLETRLGVLALPFERFMALRAQEGPEAARQSGNPLEILVSQRFKVAREDLLGYLRLLLPVLLGVAVYEQLPTARGLLSQTVFVASLVLAVGMLWAAGVRLYRRQAGLSFLLLAQAFPWVAGAAIVVQATAFPPLGSLWLLFAGLGLSWAGAELSRRATQAWVKAGKMDAAQAEAFQQDDAWRLAALGAGWAALLLALAGPMLSREVIGRGGIWAERLKAPELMAWTLLSITLVGAWFMRLGVPGGLLPGEPAARFRRWLDRGARGEATTQVSAAGSEALSTLKWLVEGVPAEPSLPAQRVADWVPLASLSGWLGLVMVLGACVSSFQATVTDPSLSAAGVSVVLGAVTLLVASFWLAVPLLPLAGLVASSLAGLAAVLSLLSLFPAVQSVLASLLGDGVWIPRPWLAVALLPLLPGTIYLERCYHRLDDGLAVQARGMLILQSAGLVFLAALPGAGLPLLLTLPVLAGLLYGQVYRAHLRQVAGQRGGGLEAIPGAHFATLCLAQAYLALWFFRLGEALPLGRLGSGLLLALTGLMWAELGLRLEGRRAAALTSRAQAGAPLPDEGAVASNGNISKHNHFWPELGSLLLAVGLMQALLATATLPAGLWLGHLSLLQAALIMGSAGLVELRLTALIRAAAAMCGPEDERNRWLRLTPELSLLEGTGLALGFVSLATLGGALALTMRGLGISEPMRGLAWGGVGMLLGSLAWVWLQARGWLPAGWAWMAMGTGTSAAQGGNRLEVSSALRLQNSPAQPSDGESPPSELRAEPKPLALSAGAPTPDPLASLPWPPRGHFTRPLYRYGQLAVLLVWGMLWSARVMQVSLFGDQPALAWPGLGLALLVAAFLLPRSKASGVPGVTPGERRDWAWVSSLLALAGGLELLLDAEWLLRPALGLADGKGLLSASLTVLTVATAVGLLAHRPLSLRVQAVVKPLVFLGLMGLTGAWLFTPFGSLSPQHLPSLLSILAGCVVAGGMLGSSLPGILAWPVAGTVLLALTSAEQAPTLAGLALVPAAAFYRWRKLRLEVPDPLQAGLEKRWQAWLGVMARLYLWLGQEDSATALAVRPDSDRSGAVSPLVQWLENGVYLRPIKLGVSLAAPALIFLALTSDPGMEAGFSAGFATLAFLLMLPPRGAAWVAAPLTGLVGLASGLEPLDALFLVSLAAVVEEVARWVRAARNPAPWLSSLEQASLTWAVATPFVALLVHLTDLEGFLGSPLAPGLALLLAGLALAQATRRGDSWRLGVAVLALDGSLLLGLLYLGSLFPSPHMVGLLAWLSLLSAVSAAVYHGISWRRSGWLASLEGWSGVHLSLTLACASLAGPLETPAGDGTPLVLLALGLAAGVAGLAGVRRGLERRVYLAETALLSMWLWLRLVSPYASAMKGWEALFLAGFAFALVGLAELTRRASLNVVARPALGSAALLPLVALGVELVFGRLEAPLLAALGGVYLLQYFLLKRTRALLAALGLFNGMFFLAWQQRGLSDPQLYLVPVGLSMALLAQLYRQRLSRGVLLALWNGAALVIFSGSFYQSLQTPWNSLILLLFALGGVGAGVFFRVRSYLYLGTGFVLAAVGMNLARFGLSHPQFWALYLTVLGLGILGGMVFFTWKKEALRALLSRFRDETAAWD